MANIKGTFELVSGTYQGLSTGEWVAIGVALLSFIGVLINTFFTTRMTKNINENNNKLQENFNQTNSQLQQELNKNNIDANLKAKARIEWIQNVRNTSAELLSLYYQLLNLTDKSVLVETFKDFQEKAELLILFFGPETEKQNRETISSILLESVESNEGKNYLIVEFLSKLNSDFYLYYKKVLSDEKSTLEDILKQRWEIVYKNPIGWKEHEPSYDNEGNEWSNNEPILNPDLVFKAKEMEKEIQEYILFSNNLNERLIQLRNIIRIYLKIEWNKAKEGK